MQSPLAQLALIRPSPRTLVGELRRGAEARRDRAAIAVLGVIEHVQLHRRVLAGLAPEIVAQGQAPVRSFEELFEPAMQFLRNPWKLWASGQLALKRTVLRLALAERIAYCRKMGLRTVKTALPFRLLDGLSCRDLRLVEPIGFEPPDDPLLAKQIVDASRFPS